MAFDLRKETTGRFPVLLLNGYIEKTAAEAIAKAVDGLLQSGQTTLILDFTQAPVVNSVALAELIDLTSVCISRPEVRFAFCGLSTTCRFTFRTVGMFHYAKEFPTSADAMAGFA